MKDSVMSGPNAIGRAIIGSISGLHARPAAMIVQRAKEFSGQIEFAVNGKKANAKSLLAVLTLGAVQGDSVDIWVAGENAEQMLAEMKKLLEADLG